MSSGYHPENIFRDGPTSLDPEGMRTELANDRAAIVSSGLGLAFMTAIQGAVVVPQLVEAAYQANANNVTSYGIIGGLISGLSAATISNIRAHRRRMAQAHSNQELNKIAVAEGIEPKAL